MNTSFPKGFIWGAASAAYQIEGAYKEDGKGLGIWDALSEGYVKHSENGNIACDHYHRFKDDIALMKSIGLKAYRFSISWPRIMPEENVVNEKGIQFYKCLTEELLEAGILPMCTLYHWNMPMWVHEKGGWHWAGISDCFADYTRIVVKVLSGNVTHWMTLNEPAAFIGSGYIMGNHAPFERGLDDKDNFKPLICKLSKNVLLAHGKAVQAIREFSLQVPVIGTALNGGLTTPWDLTVEGINAAKEATFSEQNYFGGIDWWAGPMINGTVPTMMQNAISQQELDVINQPLDFMGYNCYSSGNYDDSYASNTHVLPGMPRTAMDWVITPDSLYWATKFFNEKYRLPILITENGMANLDFVMSDGKVHDPQRIEYIRMYLKGLRKAANENIPIIGYLYWSLLDNFEWAEGYDKRFGLVHVDYQTQIRTLKDSAFWYRQVIDDNGANLI
jgi:beta-glucosidase